MKHCEKRLPLQWQIVFEKKSYLPRIWFRELRFRIWGIEINNLKRTQLRIVTRVFYFMHNVEIHQVRRLVLTITNLPLRCRLLILVLCIIILQWTSIQKIMNVYECNGANNVREVKDGMFYSTFIPIDFLLVEILKFGLVQNVKSKFLLVQIWKFWVVYFSTASEWTKSKFKISASRKWRFWKKWFYLKVNSHLQLYKNWKIALSTLGPQ